MEPETLREVIIILFSIWMIFYVWRPHDGT